MGSVGYCKVLDRDRNKQGSFLSFLQKARRGGMVSSLLLLLRSLDHLNLQISCTGSLTGQGADGGSSVTLVLTKGQGQGQG